MIETNLRVQNDPLRNGRVNFGVQQRVSRWIENPKGRSRKKLGIKAYDYVPLDHSQQALLPTSGSNDTSQFNQLLPTITDEMLEDIGAIAELKLNGIITHSFFLFVHCFV